MLKIAEPDRRPGASLEGEGARKDRQVAQPDKPDRLPNGLPVHESAARAARVVP